MAGFSRRSGRAATARRQAWPQSRRGPDPRIGQQQPPPLDAGGPSPGRPRPPRHEGVADIQHWQAHHPTRPPGLRQWPVACGLRRPGQLQCRARADEQNAHLCSGHLVITRPHAWGHSLYFARTSYFITDLLRVKNKPARDSPLAGPGRRLRGSFDGRHRTSRPVGDERPAGGGSTPHCGPPDVAGMHAAAEGFSRASPSWRHDPPELGSLGKIRYRSGMDQTAVRASEPQIGLPR